MHRKASTVAKNFRKHTFCLFLFSDFLSHTTQWKCAPPGPVNKDSPDFKLSAWLRPKSAIDRDAALSVDREDGIWHFGLDSFVAERKKFS